ncbi:MAG: hypothetical protein V7K76_26075 [Nostoc sp.]|uniref:hypothetical protein n=1 Tax=Nostoc sp. TaxID=1180 RepID=UPI002FF51787
MHSLSNENAIALLPQKAMSTTGFAYAQLQFIFLPQGIRLRGLRQVLAVTLDC